MINFIKLMVIFSLLNVLQGKTISIDEYLARVVQKHPFFSSKDLNPQVLEKEKEILRSMDDWQIYAKNNHIIQKSVKENSLSPERVFNNSLQAGIKKNLE